MISCLCPQSFDEFLLRSGLVCLADDAGCLVQAPPAAASCPAHVAGSGIHAHVVDLVSLSRSGRPLRVLIARSQRPTVSVATSAAGASAADVALQGCAYVPLRSTYARNFSLLVSFRSTASNYPCCFRVSRRMVLFRGRGHDAA